MSDNSRIDEHSGTSTTKHSWDGIEELDTPMPKWWLGIMYLTIVWAIGYMVVMPAIPLINGYTKGLLGFSDRVRVAQAVEDMHAERAVFAEKLEGASIEQISNDPDLLRFAVEQGKTLFGDNCETCHGRRGQGVVGYPNLNDDDWLWGGDMAAIYTTIAHGVRNGEDDDNRESQMPAFGVDGVLDKDQIASVTEFVLKLSKQDHDEKLVDAGSAIFAENCAACHGENGMGDRELGAPNLADAISLYGNTRPTIRAQITKPKQGVMPPWVDRLGEAAVKQLTIYVHGLGGGEKAKRE